MKELRIIGGKARGLRINSVPSDSTRPVTDKVREALFNIIGADIQEATLLDLFAGTGSIGIEALSRGAKSVYFVERNRQACAVVRENLEITALHEGAEIVHSDAFAFLDRTQSFPFDYIYIAPPQYKKMWVKALIKLDGRSELLSTDAWVIVQIHPVEYQSVGVELPLHRMVEFDQRHYGSTLLVFYHPLLVT